MNTVPQFPHDMAAEQAVLGSVMIDPEALWHIRGDLLPADFHDPKHAAIYRQMLMLADVGQPIDAVTLSGALRDVGKWDGEGVSDYIIDMIGAVPSSINIQGYMQRVLESSRRRHLLDMAAEIARRAYNTQQDVDCTLTWLVGEVQEHGRGGQLQSALAVSHRVYDELEFNVSHPLKLGQVRGLDTGWRDINGKLGGWKPGLYVVLGEPHVGKSWFALLAAANVAAQGKRVLLFSLEMGATQLVRRLILSHEHITQNDYDLGNIRDDAWPMLSARVGEVGNWALDIVDDLETASSIFATIFRECRGDNPPALVVIDYLGLVVSDYNRESVNYEIGALLRAMKRVADQCRVPLLVPHQISDKNIEGRQDKHPRKSDAYGTGGASQHADVILGLFRDELHNEMSEKPNTMEVLVLKDRLSGQADPYTSIELYFESTGALKDKRL